MPMRNVPFQGYLQLTQWQCLTSIHRPPVITLAGCSKTIADIVGSMGIRVTSSGFSKDVGQTLLFAEVFTV